MTLIIHNTILNDNIVLEDVIRVYYNTDTLVLTWLDKDGHEDFMAIDKGIHFHIS